MQRQFTALHGWLTGTLLVAALFGVVGVDAGLGRGRWRRAPVRRRAVPWTGPAGREPLASDAATIEALAALVHPDGSGAWGWAGSAIGSTNSTPAQAHYSFKALFQPHRSFGFVLRRQATAERVPGQGRWRNSGSPADVPRCRALLVTLIPARADGWRLSELTT